MAFYTSRCTKNTRTDYTLLFFTSLQVNFLLNLGFNAEDDPVGTSG